MRGSAPQATEYKTNLNALPLIGSIRFVRPGPIMWKWKPGAADELAKDP
jgi:hypothetical protein